MIYYTQCYSYSLAPFKPFVDVYHTFPWIHNSFRGVALITLHKRTHNSCFMIVATMSELVCYLATRWHGFLSSGSHQPCYWSSDCLSHHSLPQKLPLVNSLCPRTFLRWIAKNHSDSVEDSQIEEMTALIDILIFNFSVYFSERIMNWCIHLNICGILPLPKHQLLRWHLKKRKPPSINWN